jgi:predicted transcriptional regulator
MSAIATSLKLPKSLKDRISRLARQAGESPHALMVRLLEEKVQAAERFEAFLADARQADARMQESGKGYLSSDVHGYLEARLAGRKTRRPKPAQWRR